MGTPTNIRKLLERYRNKTATIEEIELVEAWYSQLKNTGEWQWREGERDSLQAQIESGLLAAINNTQNIKKPQPAIFKLKNTWIKYAAAIVILVSIATYFIVTRETDTLVRSSKSTDDQLILPGKEGAILTLSDGSQVVLDSMEKGYVGSQTGTEIILQSGQLSYNPTTDKSATTEYNTLVTPHGRQFTIKLSDGTKVWLNAASSIKYPTKFHEATRKVEVTGEVYFEVAPNQRQPFQVEVHQQALIEVLGTRFNVNAYGDEHSVQATLLEGSVKVITARSLTVPGKPTTDEAVILQPGEQARLIVNNATLTQTIAVKTVATENVIAWKNGFFNFENEDLQSVMKQLERWYNIEVIYEKGIPNIHFIGKISRSMSLQGVLKTLEESEVRYRLEGQNRLIVMP